MVAGCRLAVLKAENASGTLLSRRRSKERANGDPRHGSALSQGPPRPAARGDRGRRLRQRREPVREVADQSQRCRNGISQSTEKNESKSRRTEVAPVADEGGHFLHRRRVVTIGSGLSPPDSPTGLADRVTIEVDEGYKLLLLLGKATKCVVESAPSITIQGLLLRGWC